MKRGVLINNLITKFSNCYGLAVRKGYDTMGNMKRDINAILKHLYLTNEDLSSSMTYALLTPKVGADTNVTLFPLFFSQ